MPVQTTYPGVYVQAITAPAPASTGVATSLTAFLGRTPMGPVCTPTLINNFGDFERKFGGLDPNSSVSYAVQDFFNNGGNQALIVRLFTPYYATQAELSQAQSVVGSMQAAMAGATKVSDIETKILPAQLKLYTGFELTVAQNYSAAVTAQLNALGSNPTAAQIGTATAAAAQEVVPNAKGMFTFTAIAGAVQAAQAVAEAAYNASLSAPDDTSTVQFAARATASGYDQNPAMTAGQQVTTLTVAPQGTTLPAGTAAGVAAYFAIPTAAVNSMSTVNNYSLATDKRFTTFNQTYTALTAALGPIQTAATNPTTTPDQMLTTVTQQAKNPALGALVQAAQNAYDSGEAALGMGLAVAVASGTVLIDAWPSQLAMTLMAANEGAWAQNLIVWTDQANITSATAQQMNVPLAQIFNLYVQYVDTDGTSLSETFRNVTMNANGGNSRLDTVLLNQSNFLRVPVDADGNPNWANEPVAPEPNAVGLPVPNYGVDSQPLDIQTYLGSQEDHTGIYALDTTTIFNILCIPPDVRGGDTPPYVYAQAAQYCANNLAMLIIDPPYAWGAQAKAGNISTLSTSYLGSLSPDAARSAALYFPRIIEADPLNNGALQIMPACGAIAGIWAATDVQRGVWKAPAGLGAALNAVSGLQYTMTDAENGELNPIGINCLRTFPVGGTVVWGARTLQGADQLQDQYKYIPVRRLLYYIEDYLLQNTRWAVFEPNDETLWSQLRAQVGSFMSGLFRQGAFAGTSADQAYFVNCDASTTTPSDIAAGVVNVQVGFAPLLPAEFVVFTIQQIAGQAAS